MTSYKCWFFVAKLPQPRFNILHAETDAEARGLVSHILRDSPQIDRVEVWRDGDLAFRLNQHQIHLEMRYAGRA
jgi:hypothetical protein